METHAARNVLRTVSSTCDCRRRAEQRCGSVRSWGHIILWRPTMHGQAIARGAEATGCSSASRWIRYAVAPSGQCLVPTASGAPAGERTPRGAAQEEKPNGTNRLSVQHDLWPQPGGRAASFCPSPLSRGDHGRPVGQVLLVLDENMAGVMLVQTLEERALHKQVEELPACNSVIGLGGGQALDVAKYVGLVPPDPLVSGADGDER